jgi:hypothetical protein
LPNHHLLEKYFAEQCHPMTKEKIKEKASGIS